MDTIAVYTLMFDEVYRNTMGKDCYVFLCGGAEKNHIRNNTRTLLERKHFKVLYPEDLFMEMMNKNKTADLLEYENFLADNADVICIICESMGSAVELGAFVQSEKIKSKLVVVINQKHARDKSFIMLGPVKHLRKYKKDRIVIFKSEQVEKLVEDLSKEFKKINRANRRKNIFYSSELSTYIAFIPIVVYFFKSIQRKVLYKDIKSFFSEYECLPSKFNELFNASIKFLLKSGVLISEYSQSSNGETLSLSDKGYTQVLETLSVSSVKNKTVGLSMMRYTNCKKECRCSFGDFQPKGRIGKRL